MKQLGEVLQLSVKYLQDRKISSPRRAVELVISSILLCKRIDLYMRFDQPMVESELERVRFAIKRLAAGEPIEYVLGEVEFYGATISVDRRVLIPRVETEFLVERVAQLAPVGAVVWDLCSGSGCIGISLKKARRDLNVTLLDISPDAIELSKENVRKNLVDVEVLESDLFSSVSGRVCDVLCVNPPYISESEYVGLDDSVRLFEPKLALVGGETGFEFYAKIASHLKQFLKSGGRACFEMGYAQSDGLKKIFFSAGFDRFEVTKDLSGKDRFFFLEMQ